MEAMPHANVEANGTKVKKPDKAIWLHIYKKKSFKLNKREQRTPLPNNNGCNNIVNCPVLKEFIIIASRVLKTRDSIETRVFKTRFTRFADSLTWKIFATWRFQTPLLIPSLSVSQALSISEALSLSL